MIHVRVEAAKSIKNAAARINKKNCPLGEVPKGLFLESYFIVLDANDYYDALNTNAVELAAVKGGKIIAESVPGVKKTMF